MKFQTYSLILYFSVFGIITNIYIIIKLSDGFSILETFQNTKVPPSKCVIDVDHFLEFSENRHVMKLKENELAIINGRTVQTMLYAFPNAGLGNRLFELISLLGIASTLQRRAVINATNPNYMSHLHQTMQPLFPKLVEQFELRVIPESSVARQQINWSRCCIFDDPAKVLDISNQHVILDGHYFQSFKYFHHIRTKIREWMAPKELAKSKAEKLIPFSVKDNFIICPHIRRGDFETDGLHQPSDPTFTRAATDFLVEKYQKTRRHVTVVVFGNDMSFAHTVFEDRVGNISFALNPNATALNYTLPEYSPTYDVILTPQSTPEIDLAFSRTFCDATLFTGPSSTFGWWLSYLAKSSAKVYYRDILETKDGVINDMKVEDFYPPEWIKLRVRLLNDPNKWVSFIAYQQLGPFISLFANPDITGLELRNGQVVVRDPVVLEPSVTEQEDPSNSTFSEDTSDDFRTLPKDTWLPEVDFNDDFEYQLGSIDNTQNQKELTTVTTALVKTPKRGERVMDSVLSGINKMFGSLERSSPKSKEVEKIAATFSSPSKRSPLSLHSAVSLIDKFSKRSNPNNPQRFPVFDSANSDSTLSSNSSNNNSSEQQNSTGIAAKCSSTDDLTKLGLEDDDYMENSGPKFNTDEDSTNDSDSDDEDNDFEKSFVADEDDGEQDDSPLSIEIKSSSSSDFESVSAATPTSQEPVSNEFSLTYWSSNYAISSIEDELKPFGSSSSFTNSPTSNSYLESRFDVMKVNLSPRARSVSFGTNGSPISTSPRRKANSTSEPSPPNTGNLKSDDSIVMLNTEEKEKLGILDFDEMNMSISSNSSIHGEAAMTEDSDISLTSIEQAALQHVPVDLVESYMRVMGPIGGSGSGGGGNGSSTTIATGDPSLCAETYRHCAHNFPAVCYTLGRAAWPRLKLVFRKLAMDEQARVRQSISHSIHEIANMLGQEITDEDLLPVFYDLRNDQNPDVRNGILIHLYDFVKFLSPEKRDEMILSLPQFFPIGAQPGNQAQNGDWRSRFELISQLSKLCSLYSIQDVNFHMSGIALTLADDRVAEVRREAVMLVSTIVGALVTAEWDNIKGVRDIENGHVDVKKKSNKTDFLSEQFVDDIVSSFAKTQKWTRRQTFCFICAQILRDKQCDGIQFRYFFATPLQQLAQDKVPNVRLASCEALSVWRKTLIAARAQERRGQSPISSPASEPSAIRRDINLVSDMMVKLSNDSDIDAAFIAKKCQGLTDDHQPVDVASRTTRMREREEQFFGDIILSYSPGCNARVSGKEIKQLIRHDQGAVQKAAPLQSMEDFGDEILAHAADSVNIQTPPEVVATVQRVSITNEQFEDNTEAVDMEIEEDEDENSTEKKENTEKTAEEESENVKNTEDELDIPMDPAPTLPPPVTSKNQSSSPITASSSDNNETSA